VTTENHASVRSAIRCNTNRQPKLRTCPASTTRNHPGLTRESCGQAAKTATTLGATRYSKMAATPSMMIRPTPMPIRRRGRAAACSRTARANASLAHPVICPVLPSESGADSGVVRRVNTFHCR
jgi:hypothetical protein